MLPFITGLLFIFLATLGMVANPVPAFLAVCSPEKCLPGKFAEAGPRVLRISPIGVYCRSTAPVAQLDRVPPSEGGGHRFNSCRARHFPGMPGWLLSRLYHPDGFR